MVQRTDSTSAIFRWLAAIARFVFFALLPPSVLYLIVSPSARRRVLFQVLSLLLVSYLVLRISPSLRAQAPALPPPEVAGAGGAEPASGPDAAAAPRWLIVGISSLVALAVLAAGYWIVRRTRRVKKPRIGELRQPLPDLDRGQRDLESVIYQAYRALCEVGEERRGIRRAQAMTPREYQGALETATLPHGPVASLTMLFERARYGRERLGRKDEQAATAALRSILQEIEQS